MLTVTLLKGLPGSGKSTWAKKQILDNPGQYKRIETDALREMFDVGKWSPSNEKFMLKSRDDLILQALEAGKHVIVDATNLHPRHELHIRDLVKGKATFDVQDFTLVPIEDCVERDLKRENSVGEKVIRDMYNKYIKLKPEVLVYNSALPPCIICDLDGTIALNDWRDPYDATECEKDGVNIPIVNILRAHVNWLNNTKIIFVSGREEKYRWATEKWLDVVFHDFKFTTNLAPCALYMRNTDDVQKDAIIKEEIYNKEIKDKYNVLFVLDDRLQTCRMWYNLGLPLLRVGDPDASF